MLFSLSHLVKAQCHLLSTTTKRDRAKHVLWFLIQKACIYAWGRIRPRDICQEDNDAKPTNGIFQWNKILWNGRTVTLQRFFRIEYNKNYCVTENINVPYYINSNLKLKNTNTSLLLYNICFTTSGGLSKKAAIDCKILPQCCTKRK